MGEQGEQGEQEKFSVEVGILRVNKELDEIEAEEFAEAVVKLVKSGVAAPRVDIEESTFIPSYQIDGIRSAAEEARRDGRSLTVRGRRSVIVMLERMGVGTIARLREAEKRPSKDSTVP